jgi:hypothetical protein
MGTGGEFDGRLETHNSTLTVQPQRYTLGDVYNKINKQTTQTLEQGTTYTTTHTPIEEKKHVQKKVQQEIQRKCLFKACSWEIRSEEKPTTFSE